MFSYQGFIDIMMLLLLLLIVYWLFIMLFCLFVWLFFLFLLGLSSCSLLLLIISIRFSSWWSSSSLGSLSTLSSYKSDLDTILFLSNRFVPISFIFIDCFSPSSPMLSINSFPPFVLLFVLQNPLNPRCRIAAVLKLC